MLAQLVHKVKLSVRFLFVALQGHLEEAFDGLVARLTLVLLAELVE